MSWLTRLWYAANTAEQIQSLGHGHLLHGSEVHTIAESPAIYGVPTADGPNPRTHSPLLFDSPFSSPVPDSSLSLCLETKRLIVSTCRTVVKLELALSNIDAKSCILEQHRAMGIFPKDLSLPKNKSLFEDERSKVDEILQKASSALLIQRIAEISRKISETLAQRSVEDALLKIFESS